ncbi:DEAD/DEAH box helicase [Listeria seeligeri]|uniref:DEAD/DEAH box helicase n=1 Tax=Listeria seeligeri TaxID=1640 RepID=UPI0018883877|nr:DEAD/DEAH box helicase [Listeria seeligeri]MBF2375153.1 DEAD/DEAH box helicase [Listeria seeligeri]
MKNIHQKIKLNKLQGKTVENKGKDLLINAPTGSGKTEASLLAVSDASKSVSYLLPTVVSTNVMYLRLKRDYKLNLSVQTSTKKEISNLAEGVHIKLECPDFALIDFIKTGKKTLGDTIICDEFDHYPEMVKSALMEYKHTFSETQIIFVSATLNKESLMGIDVEEIAQDTEKNLIKYKVYPNADFRMDNIINNAKADGKKVGIIFNSISQLECFIKPGEDFYDDHFSKFKKGENDYIIHSQVDDYDKALAENAIVNNDFSVLIGTDSISYSIDVNFDILIMMASSEMATNIQRLGRCNRLNKHVTDYNLYFFGSYLSDLKAPFINENLAFNNLERITSSHLCISRKNINEIKKELPVSEIMEYIEVKKHVLDEEESLRPIPFKVRRGIEKEVVKFNAKGLKQTKVIKTYQTFNMMDLKYAFCEEYYYDKKNSRALDVIQQFDFENDWFDRGDFTVKLYNLKTEQQALKQLLLKLEEYIEPEAPDETDEDFYYRNPDILLKYTDYDKLFIKGWTYSILSIDGKTIYIA